MVLDSRIQYLPRGLSGPGGTILRGTSISSWMETGTYQVGLVRFSPMRYFPVGVSWPSTPTPNGKVMTLESGR